jgi:hypothetical protein
LEKRIPNPDYKTKGELYRIERATFSKKKKRKPRITIKGKNNQGTNTISGLNLKNDKRRG